MRPNEKPFWARLRGLTEAFRGVVALGDGCAAKRYVANAVGRIKRPGNEAGLEAQLPSSSVAEAAASSSRRR